MSFADLKKKFEFGRLRLSESPPGEFDEIAAEGVSVHGEVMDDDSILFLIGHYDDADPDAYFRLSVFVERGRWLWSNPKLGYTYGVHCLHKREQA
jgi:hypothetical protein